MDLELKIFSPILTATAVTITCIFHPQRSITIHIKYLKIWCLRKENTLLPDWLINHYDENFFFISEFFQAFIDLLFKHVHVHIFNSRKIFWLHCGSKQILIPHKTQRVEVERKVRDVFYFLTVLRQRAHQQSFFLSGSWRTISKTSAHTCEPGMWRTR